MNKWLFYLNEIDSKKSSGNHDYYRGKLYMENHQWGDAIKALEQAFDKDQLDFPKEVARMLSDCYLKIGNSRNAHLWDSVFKG